MSTGQEHKALIQTEFTKQATAYAANPAAAAGTRGERLVRLARPEPGMQALDVATGPGYLAEALAVAGCQVIGVDLTEAPLRIAEARCREHGVANIRFQQADAESLPFEDDRFDLVFCGWAFHHLQDPTIVMAEMVRVCRPGGVIVVDDLMASERPEQAAYHNEVERLRDPSHTRALPVSELLRLAGHHSLRLRAVETYPVVHAVETWMERAQTPPEPAAEVRRRFAADLPADLSGMHPYEQDGVIYLMHTMALCVWEYRPALA